MEDPSAPDFDSVDVNPYIEDAGRLVSALVQHGPTAPRMLLPRRFRITRQRWRNAAKRLRYSRTVPPTVRSDGFTDRPYLAVHPEREIAELRGLSWIYAWPECAACGWTGDLGPNLMATGEREAHAIAAAHAHNAERHPRRWLRSQHFQASIPADIRDRSNA